MPANGSPGRTLLTTPRPTFDAEEVALGATGSAELQLGMTSESAGCEHRRDAELELGAPRGGLILLVFSSPEK